MTNSGSAFSGSTNYVFSFGYNVRSEVTNAIYSKTTGTNNYDYSFDTLGNRQSSWKTGGSTNTYLANQLNQYTNIAGAATNNLVFDADGNLLSDGLYTNSWSDENRLIAIEPVSPTNGSKKLTFGYDYMGRRFERVVYTRSGTSWINPSTNTFAYQGWNPIAEVATNATNYYVWGLDLSGTLQGAGGVGGLLIVRINGTNYFPTYDANGNVGQLVDASDGSLKAEYEYAPFGGIIKQTGSAASSNPFRFSTKYFDDETELSYYGYRYYDAEKGRWVNRGKRRSKPAWNRR